MKIIGVILARMDSSRLPNKALREIRGVPLLGYVIKRAQLIPELTKVCIATTSREVDQPIADYGQMQGIPVYRGDCNNVLQRFYEAASAFDADYALRLNGDSPFVDKGLIQQGISICRDNEVDLVSNIYGSRTFPYGISVEIIKMSAMKKMYAYELTKEHKEHITKFFYDHSADFNIYGLTSRKEYSQDVHMVVDTQTDFQLFSQVVSALGSNVLTEGFEEIYHQYILAKNLKANKGAV